MSEGANKSIDKKGSRSKSVKMNWATYLHKVKQQVHPNLGMASDAMIVLNALVEDYKDRMIKASINCAADNKSGTVKAKHTRTAAALLLDGQLLKHTNSEGEKAWVKYVAAEEAAAKAKALAKKQAARVGKRAGCLDNRCAASRLTTSNAMPGPASWTPERPRAAANTSLRNTHTTMKPGSSEATEPTACKSGPAWFCGTWLTR